MNTDSSNKKMKIKRISAIAGVVTALCAAIIGAWYYWPIWQTQQRVKAMLKDPDSAKFEQVRYNRSTEAGCGLVNAKNSMGGYVGLRHFVAPKSGEVKFQPNVDSESGTTEQRIKALEQEIEYLEYAKPFCD